MSSQPQPPDPEEDPRLEFLAEVLNENDAVVAAAPDSSGAFPAFMELVGDLAEALTDLPMAEVRSRAIKAASVLMRLGLEGDANLTRIRMTNGADHV